MGLRARPYYFGAAGTLSLGFRVLGIRMYNFVGLKV